MHNTERRRLRNIAIQANKYAILQQYVLYCKQDAGWFQKFLCTKRTDYLSIPHYVSLASDHVVDKVKLI